MKPCAVSLIIVSQKRPKELERVIASLVYQSVTNFEIIVVADAPPLVSKFLKPPVKFIQFNETNISRARNIGIEAARAQIVAFCDDDALPDPFWLERICKPFYQDKQVAAAAGFCRGRNGVSFQWKGVAFNKYGQDFHLDIAALSANQILSPHPDYFYKAVGTNCAYRKSTLHKIGGFDESFFYFLEDADINLRLQNEGYKTAIIPKAEIIHNYAESRGRASNRVPKSLYNLGASTHYFLKRHAPEDRVQNLDQFHSDQEKRLVAFFHLGLIRPRQIKGLMRDLRRGSDAGAYRESITPLKKIRSTKMAALKLRDLTLELSRIEPVTTAGDIIPIQLRMLPTTHGARLTFRRKGYWRMTFGRFGRLHRNEPWYRYRFRKTAIKRIENFLLPRFTRQEETAK